MSSKECEIEVAEREAEEALTAIKEIIAKAEWDAAIAPEAKCDVVATFLGEPSDEAADRMYGIVITIPEAHLDYYDGTRLDLGQTVGFRVLHGADGKISTPDILPSDHEGYGRREEWLNAVLDTARGSVLAAIKSDIAAERNERRW